MTKPFCNSLGPDHYGLTYVHSTREIKIISRRLPNLYVRGTHWTNTQCLLWSKLYHKGDLISDSILILVPLPAKGAKSLPWAENLNLPSITTLVFNFSAQASNLAPFIDLLRFSYLYILEKKSTCHKWFSGFLQSLLNFIYQPNMN